MQVVLDLLLMAGFFALLGLVAGFLIGRNERTPQRESLLAQDFERGARQLRAVDEHERLFGVVTLEGVATVSRRYRGYVLRLFADFLRERAKGKPTTILMQPADGSPPDVQIELRAMVEALGRLSRQATETDLKSLDLEYTNLSGAQLSRTNFSGAKMGYSTFASADLSSAVLRNVDLRSANLQYARLRRANLSARVPSILIALLTAPIKDLTIIMLSIPVLPVLVGGVVGFLALLGITISAPAMVVLVPLLVVLRIVLGIFSGLSQTVQSVSNTKHVRKIAESLELSRSTLACADLRHADLRDANLYGANLQEANLCYANLAGAQLARADLRGADLSQALHLYPRQVASAITNEHTKLPGHIRLRQRRNTTATAQLPPPHQLELVADDE